MQMQADISDTDVRRPVCVETTAVGAAYLAELAVGYWSSTDDVIANRSIDRIFSPMTDPKTREEKISGWKTAVARALGSSF